MANGNKNYVSIWFWILAMIVMALPCINVIMIVVWAFYGDNESRKNYFRALIILFLLGTILWFILVAVGLIGFSPEILKHIQFPGIKAQRPLSGLMFA
jgi:RsiW-degrading membrane proteinase PrsW (M82 family)